MIEWLVFGFSLSLTFIIIIDVWRRTHAILQVREKESY